MVVHHGRIHCIMAEFIASSMQWHCIMAEFIASWMQWRAEGDHESCGRQINKYTFIVDIFRCASVQCISIHFGWILERRLSINRFADKVLPLCIESKCVSLLWCTLGLLNMSNGTFNMGYNLIDSYVLVHFIARSGSVSLHVQSKHEIDQW